MKNILLYETFSNFGSKDIDQLKDAETFCVDSLSNVVYVALPSSILAFCLNTKLVIKTISWGGTRNPESGNTTPVSFDFLQDDFQLCAILRNGTVVLIDLTSNTLTCPAEITTTVKGASWCLDFQSVILVTNEKLYHFTRDFNLLNEADLAPAEVGKDQLMTIGWGTRETQFQGSAGRKALKENDYERIATQIKNYDDPEKVIISWRADSAFFTVSSVEEMAVSEGGTGFTRVMRTWSREGEFMAQFETLAGIEPVMAMKPVGNYIATVRTLNEKRVLRFYERNGQIRHNYDITNSIPVTDKVILNLSWNTDGTILSFHVKDINTNKEEIQFWTVSNYDWAIKYCFQAPFEIAQTKWNDVDPQNFKYLLKNGLFASIFLDPKHYNVCEMNAVVVNGNEIRVTNLNVAPIPPPMSLYQLKLKECINFVSQDPSGKLMALSSDNLLNIFQLENDRYKIVKIVDLKQILENINCGFVFDIRFATSSSITFIFQLGSYQMMRMDLETLALETIFTTDVYNVISFIPLQSIANFYILQTQNGDWFQYGNENNEFEPFIFDGKQVQLRTYDSHNSQYLEKEGILISLTNTGQLLFNDKNISSAVGSFCVGDEFVLVTSLSNLLYCFPRETLKNITTLPSTGRMVERGSRLVSFDPRGTRVWLQMPRGNLETIQPRTMLLFELKKLFDQNEWKKAHIEMRRHRIDMNLMFDHDPEKFLLNIPNIIDQINDADLLNLFIMTLTDQLSTTSMFAELYPTHVGKTFDNKINIICNSFLDYLWSINQTDAQRMRGLFSTVLSCYVKQSPSLLKEALYKIKCQMATFDNNESFKFLEDSLRHLLYMVDGNALFKEAISTYDWKIALNVAECSQRDPKEYIPLLNDLKSKKPECYQKFCADMYLDHAESALKHIALAIEEDKENADNHMEECLNLIKFKSLYSASLVVFKGKESYGKICNFYGDFLEAKGKISDAAIMFLKCNEIGKAVVCFEKSKNWFEWLKYGKMLGFDDQKIKDTLKRLGNLLEALSDQKASIQIHTYLSTHYEDQKQESQKRLINLYATVNDWTSGSRLAADDKALQTLFNLKLKERAHKLTAGIDAWRNSFKEHTERLAFLRTDKQSKIKELMNAALDDEGFEMQSEASSTISTFSKMSKMSTASGRRKKTVEKKKKHMKVGSQYEDIGRLSELRNICKSVDNQQDEMVCLLPTLLLWDLIEEARTLQLRFGELIEEIERKTKQNWPYYIKAFNLLGPIHEIYRKEDGNIEMPDAGEMPERICIEKEMIPPKIRTNITWRLDMLR
uniref:Elongator complex protein 1 n=1 Tax=Rhabditophanes sp. KR3021 TaxID=114890 RepID=A0AC35U0I8_9BILA